MTNFLRRSKKIPRFVINDDPNEPTLVDDEEVEEGGDGNRIVHELTIRKQRLSEGAIRINEVL